MPAIQSRVVSVAPNANDAGVIVNYDLRIDVIFFDSRGSVQTLEVTARVTPGDNAATVRSIIAQAVRDTGAANGYTIGVNQCYLFDFVRA